MLKKLSRAALGIGSVAVAVAVVGCGSDDGISESATGASRATTQGDDGTGANRAGGVVDPCALLTNSEIQAEFGYEVQERTGPTADPSAPTGRVCKWDLSDGGVKQHMTLETFDPAPPYGPYKQLEDMKNQYIQPVSEFPSPAMLKIGHSIGDAMMSTVSKGVEVTLDIYTTETLSRDSVISAMKTAVGRI